MKDAEEAKAVPESDANYKAFIAEIDKWVADFEKTRGGLSEDMRAATDLYISMLMANDVSWDLAHPYGEAMDEMLRHVRVVKKVYRPERPKWRRRMDNCISIAVHTWALICVYNLALMVWDGFK